MYLGIDIGTSSVKSVLVNETQELVGSSTRPLPVFRPRPTWSEQDPGDWWAATVATLDRLRAEHPAAMAAVGGIGLSGQMHGATLLDGSDRPLRPCILWNDMRAVAECAELESACPRSRDIAGNIAMPGFTAPKLLWVRNHEPGIFDATARVLLPKDYVRLRMSGEYASDMSDAAGTLWMDVAGRDWSDELLAATGLGREHMPRLVEGTDVSGRLRPELAVRWGMTRPPVIAGGAGDNAASACGIGAVTPGAAFLSLGTSGVIFVCTAHVQPDTRSALHYFCHAVPRAWHRMAVSLSAASCFDWLASISGCEAGDLFDDLESPAGEPGELYFLPYLSGERTPYNDASLRGSFVGLTHATTRADLARAVAEGVGFALHDGIKALADAGSRVERLTAVGGGTRSRAWLQMLADILVVDIMLPRQAQVGAAFGAARLAIVAHTGREPEQVCRPGVGFETFSPDAQRSRDYVHRWLRFRAMFPAYKEVLGV